MYPFLFGFFLAYQVRAPPAPRPTTHGQRRSPLLLLLPPGLTKRGSEGSPSPSPPPRPPVFLTSGTRTQIPGRNLKARRPPVLQTSTCWMRPRRRDRCRSGGRCPLAAGLGESGSLPALGWRRDVPSLSEEIPRQG